MEQKEKEITNQTAGSVNDKDKAASSRIDAAHPHGLTAEQINKLKPGSYIVESGKLEESEVKK